MNEDTIVNMFLFQLSIHAKLPQHYQILIAVIRLFFNILCIFNCMCTVARNFIDSRRLRIKRAVTIGTLVPVTKNLPVPLQKMRTVQVYSTS